MRILYKGCSIVTIGNENLICGPLAPEDIREEAGWQSLPYDKFRLFTKSLRSVAHVIGYNMRPLYLECGSDLDYTGIELSRRLIISAYNKLAPVEEIPERRKFFMKLAGRDPVKSRYPLKFPDKFEASRGEAARRWAVSASDGREVVQAAETFLEFAGQDAKEFLDLLQKESPEFRKEETLESVRASVVLSSGFIPKLLTVARAAAIHNTYFLSWWD